MEHTPRHYCWVYTITILDLLEHRYPAIDLKYASYLVYLYGEKSMLNSCHFNVKELFWTVSRHSLTSDYLHMTHMAPSILYDDCAHETSCFVCTDGPQCKQNVDCIETCKLSVNLIKRSMKAMMTFPTHGSDVLAKLILPSPCQRFAIGVLFHHLGSVSLQSLPFSIFRSLPVETCIEYRCPLLNHPRLWQPEMPMLALWMIFVALVKSKF